MTALSLLSLDVDAQTSIFSFLSHGDLISFIETSQGCRRVATLDRVWSSMLARHFSDVTLPFSLQSLHRVLCPVLSFRALALTPCSVCTKILLSLKPKVESTRFPNTHSCAFCGSLCCAACHCQCHCLNLECQLGSLFHMCGSLIIAPLQCIRCKGRTHLCCDKGNEQFAVCGFCKRGSCSVCNAMSACDTCGVFHCDKCRDFVDGGTCKACICSEMSNREDY
jgi:hypothetical protein